MGELIYRLRRFWYGHFSRGSVLTSLFIGTNLALFFAQLLWQYGYHSTQLDDLLALSKKGIEGGHYWELLSYGWLHSVTHLGHLIINLLFIYSLGRELEWDLGPLRYLLLYFGSLITAALIWLLFNWKSENGNALEGSSAAVFGLIVALGFYQKGRSFRLSLFGLFRFQMPARMVAFLFIGIEVISELNGWFPGVNHLVHLSGALFGLLFITIAKRRIPLVAPYKSVSPPPRNG